MNLGSLSITGPDETEAAVKKVFGLVATIDSRSFHAYERKGEHFLFDRASGTLSGITVELFAAFTLVESKMGVRAVSEAIVDSLSPDQVDNFCQVIEVLKAKDMLQFTSVDRERQKALTKSLLGHQSRRVQLLMAQGCNLGCRYCYAWRNGSNQKGTLMSFEMAKASVDFLVRRSKGRPELMVTFFGGEPLLNLPVIKEVVAYCKQLEADLDQRFTFELITNGTLLDEAVTAFIVEHKFLLFVSIDGDEEMHNYNRPSMDGTNQYPVILKNALHANREYAKAGLDTPKTRANLTSKRSDFFGTGEYLTNIGFKNVGLSIIEPLPHGDRSPSAFTEDQVDALQEQFVSTCDSAIEDILAGKEVSQFIRGTMRKALSVLRPTEIRGLSCGAGRNTATVDNKGNIYPCHRYEGMENYIIGNVETGMDPEKTLEYYDKVNDNAMARCHSCWIRDYCSGGCAWLLSAKDGHISDPTLRECDRRRRSVENSLWLRQKVRKLAPHWLSELDGATFDRQAEKLGSSIE